MAEEVAFQKGDIVRLKSGGPAMTILNPNAQGDVYCEWWNAALNEYGAKRFDAVVLQKVDKGDTYRSPVA